jgi:nitroreductase
MEFPDVIRRRRMVRHYDTDRPVPPDAVDRILRDRRRPTAKALHRGQWGQPLTLAEPPARARQPAS